MFAGELLYIHDEYSLCFRPFNKNAGVSILCGEYTSLDTICETGEIVHISGYNSKRGWVNNVLEIPRAKKGVLIAHFDKPPMNGVGYVYDRSWVTSYDTKSHCICIGDTQIEDDDIPVEFANGIVAVLRKDQQISVWAFVREVETAPMIPH